MPKLQTTTIHQPKKAGKVISVGDIYLRNKEEFKVSKIDKTENATFISVSDKNDEVMTYGSFKFLELFKVLEIAYEKRGEVNEHYKNVNNSN